MYNVIDNKNEIKAQLISKDNIINEVNNGIMNGLQNLNKNQFENEIYNSNKDCFNINMAILLRYSILY